MKLSVYLIFVKLYFSFDVFIVIHWLTIKPFFNTLLMVSHIALYFLAIIYHDLKKLYNCYSYQKNWHINSFVYSIKCFRSLNKFLLIPFSPIIKIFSFIFVQCKEKNNIFFMLIFLLYDIFGGYSFNFCFPSLDIFWY